MEPIERLSPDDLDACVALAVDRDWRPDPPRWALLLAQADVYGIRAPDGDGLAGCVSLVRYGGGALAVVGMMLVAERYGRRGLGRRLMEHALVRAGDSTVYLYATRFGRPLYERLGFGVAGAVTTCVGAFTASPVGGTRPAGDADADAIAALDAAALGADRTPLLRGFLAIADQVRVLERDGAVCGFAAARAGNGTTVVGPAVAPDLDAARTLIADVAARAEGPVRLDVDQRHDGLVAWAAQHGVAPGDATVLMVRGGAALPGDRARLILPMTLGVG